MSNYLNKYHISEDFPQILKNLTHEIIYYKPKDIIDFAYKYFYCLENKIPFNSFIIQQSTELTINSEQNTLQNETISSTINNNLNTNIINDNNDRELIKEFINITPSNNISLEDNNEVEESEIRVPLSKVMEEIFREKEEIENKKNNKERPLSAASDLSESHKKEIKDFVSDLFF